MVFQGLATHTSLARFNTADAAAQSNDSSYKQVNVNKAVDGQFVLRDNVIKTLARAVTQLGKAADNALPLTRYALTEGEAAVDQAERLPLAEQLPLLEELGLKVAPVLAPDGASTNRSRFPYHHLYLRSGTEGLEWLNWIKLEQLDAGGKAIPGAARPCLLRYRQGKPGTKGQDSTYTVVLEGLTGAHVLGIWSRLAAGPERRAFRQRYGQKVPSLLPDLLMDPSATDGETPGLFFAKITCRRTNDGPVFLGPGQTMPDLQPNEIERIEIRRCKSVLLKPGTPFPPEPENFVKLEVEGDVYLRFEDLYDTTGDKVSIRSGAVTFSTDALVFKRRDGGLALLDDVTVTMEPAPSSWAKQFRLAIGSIDFELYQRLGGRADGQKPPTLQMRSLGGFKVANLIIPIVEARVKGADSDAQLGIELKRQAAVWSTTGTALLEGGELALWHHEQDEGRESFFDIFRGTTNALKSQTEPLELTIVDPAPFFVGAVSLQPPRADAIGQDESLASWRSSEGCWRLLWLDGSIAENRLRLPAQGRAEDWERTSETAEDGSRDGIADGGRVAARFTRPAVVKVQAEERLRAPLGPWNIVETLTDAMADLPGARMTAIERLEILYGLEAHNGRTENVRIAETESWRGRPALPLVHLAPDGTERARTREWRAADSLWATRLAVIEARKDVPGTGELIENLPYRLRRKAEGAEYQAPLVREFNNDATTPEDLKGSGRLVEYTNGDEAEPEWFTDGGTTGGVFGGFERAEVVDALIRDADKGLGTMRQLAFSARGATSDGDAAFGDGLTRIAFKSELGRLTEIRFERAGRISWFRHRARHVIVYRLRATPGRQFGKEQDKHRGRLIIRKDEEFIEVIEPSREFPGRDTGPLETFEFRDRKIPVDGAWSTGFEVDGNYRGYAIPLWREEADRSIYPRPDCACHMAGPNDRIFPRSVSNPDIIRFYSLTELGGVAPSGDTDTWPNVYGVDFADRRLDEPLEDEKAIPQRQDFGSAGDPARPLPAEPLVVSGLEAFTLVLEQGEPVNLMAGRSAEPVYCDMRSLVVMRAQHSHAPAAKRATTDEVPAVVTGREIAVHATSLVEIAKKRPKSGLTLARLKDEVSKARMSIAAFPSNDRAFSGKDLAIAKQPLDRLKAVTERLAKIDEKHELDALWITGRQGLIDGLVALERELGSLLPVGKQLYAECERLLQLDDSADALAEAVAKEFAALAAQVDAVCADMVNKLGLLKGQVSADLAAVHAALSETEPHFAKARQLAAAAARHLEDSGILVQQRLRELPAHAGKIEAFGRKYANRLPALADFGRRVAANLRKAPELADQASVLEADLRGKIDRLVGLIDVGEDAKKEAQDIIEELRKSFDAEFDKAFITPIVDFRKPWTKGAAGEPATVVMQASDLAREIVDAAAKWIEQAGQLPMKEIDKAARLLLDDLLVVLHLARKAVGAEEPPAVLGRIAGLAAQLRSEIEKIIGPAQNWSVSISEALSSGQMALKPFADEALRNLAALESAIDDCNDLAEAYELIANEVDLLEQSARRFTDSVNMLLDKKALAELAKPLSQRVKADNLEEALGLRLLRGCGAPPVVENLLFNREQISYHFRSEYERIVVTPMTALVDQGQQVLRAFGVTQPVLGIGREFLSPISGAFDDVGDEIKQITENLKMRGNEVLRDLAGLKKLFPSMPYNRALAKAITIRHGFDPASGQAWLLAELDHKIGRQPIFEQEMFALVAENARLTARARFEQPVTGGEQSATSKAEVALDIVFMVGGTRLLVVREAKVLFDGGGLRFKIRPEKIEFNKLLQLVSDAIRSLTSSDSPLQLELLVDEATGRPVGVSSKYDLPPVSFGPILNAALGVHLSLVQRETFRIETMAYLGRKDAPFALVYGILGGGGYIEVHAAYIPETGRTDLAIHISIGASAGTGFSFGPLNGSVSVYLGFTLDYISRTGGQTLIIGAVLVVNGSVRAWGIVTVSLGLRLSVTYDGRQMVGVGTVTVTVKISRFYKKKFRRGIRYRP